LEIISWPHRATINVVARFSGLAATDHSTLAVDDGSPGEFDNQLHYLLPQVVHLEPEFTSYHEINRV